ncbi:hypothetical protein KIN20_031124 [Parelaphostrongylus tenuis]|uniref:Rab-GAP TBC domain-containing protein n=1 Tax=Parelaphostrongylus tenuis TaxID=148309 RepID=A0AAD5R526_PARTN|nr:hypothetical protein KIN20_031124 [Parelaphostrongylus tenuis]
MSAIHEYKAWARSGYYLNELREARDSIERSRREYVFALQSAIRIPLHDNNALDVMHVKLLGGDMNLHFKHKNRICELMHEARNNQPCLPTLQSLLTGVYVDIFGFRHKYSDEGLAIHYMAMQLHEYYQSRLTSHFEHKRKWKQFLTANETIPLTRETRILVRRGIPGSLRATVWRYLIHQKISDKKMLYGRHYFRNLCSLQGGDQDNMFCANHQKQINLDLLRTMPNNVHFMSANCKGVSQLQQVLRAFCLHNATLGYCQGMNFLASTALLFVGPEDTFWFLVAMTEYFHDKSYFDDNLAGAQADQEVLKELLEVKFPLISAHLNSLDIDLATITLNWFLALFFDAVPFNTLLRIWDCFLLEGPKILFRFSLALLGQHQDEILVRSDTIGIMKVIKAAVRLSYDVDGLFKLAFDDLGQLPSRNVLRSKQLSYLKQLNQKLSQRQRLRSLHISSGSGLSDGCDLSISDLFFSPYDPSLCYVIAGNQNQGIIGVIRIKGGKANMTVMDTEFDCRVCSFVLIREDMAFAGLISGYIIALHLHADECSILWELKLPDAPLQLYTADERLFAALANGTLTVLENVNEWSPTCLELFHIPLAPAPLIYLVCDGDDICIATACNTLSTLSTTYVACSGGGSSTPFFDKISCLAASPLGIFLCTANTALVQLWFNGDCQLLFDVGFDHQRRRPSLSDEELEFFVTSLTYFDNMLWVGTSDGYVMIYSINENASENVPKFNLKRYPSGRRLSPQGACGVANRNQTCYIPTDEEAKEEEILSLAEGIGRPSHVSINIDRGKQQYTVYRKPQDCVEDCQETEYTEKHDHIFDENKSDSISRRSSSSCIPSSSSNSYSTTTTAQRTPIMNGDYEDAHLERNASKKPMGRMVTALRSPIESTSNPSMEYDDLFEVYSEEDYNRNHSFHTRAAMPSPLKLGSESSCSCTLPLRRKDLEFNDPLLLIVPDRFASNHNVSYRRRCTDDFSFKMKLQSSAKEDENSSSNCEEGEASTSEDYQEVHASFDLSLAMKLKIADRPVKRMAATRIGESDLLLTCAGRFSESESLLLWRKEPVSGLWINDPIPPVQNGVFNH